MNGFTNIKRRGGSVVASIAIAYTLDCDVSYNELLASVEIVDPATLAPLKRAAELASDAPLIAAVGACIKDGIDTKMKLMAAVAERLGVSQRAALKAIEKYTGDDPAQHYWPFRVRERGAKVFTLLDRPDAGGTAEAA